MCVASRSLDTGLHGPLLPGLWFVLQGSDPGPWEPGQSRRRPSLLLRCGPSREQPEPSQVLSVLRGKHCCRGFTVEGNKLLNTPLFITNCFFKKIHEVTASQCFAINFVRGQVLQFPILSHFLHIMLNEPQ